MSKDMINKDAEMVVMISNGQQMDEGSKRASLDLQVLLRLTHPPFWQFANSPNHSKTDSDGAQRTWRWDGIHIPNCVGND